jgi:hypothetical protein
MHYSDKDWEFRQIAVLTEYNKGGVTTVMLGGFRTKVTVFLDVVPVALRFLENLLTPDPI